MCHDPYSRHDRSPALLCVETTLLRDHMNLTGDDTVWVGFFNLSRARRTYGDAADYSDRCRDSTTSVRLQRSRLEARFNSGDALQAK